MKKRTVEKIGLALTVTAIVGMYALLFGCGGGASSGGVGSPDQVPLTDKDNQAIQLLGGMSGQWLYPTAVIVRLERDPPPPANWAKAPCPHFVIYNTTHQLDVQGLAGLFVHEAQHIRDDCKVGEYWEYRAGRATQCWQQGIPLNQCVFKTRTEWEDK